MLLVHQLRILDGHLLQLLVQVVYHLIFLLHSLLHVLDLGGVDLPES